jgi:hypothetical protein
MEERPLAGRQEGLAECVLRIRYGHPNTRMELNRAFRALFATYADDPNPQFDCVVTANAVLRANTRASFSMYYGQDFSSGGHGDIMMGDVYQVDSMMDVEHLPIRFDPTDFSDIFNRTFRDTDVSVHSLASVVFKITKLIPNYERDKKVGSKFKTLF